MLLVLAVNCSKQKQNKTTVRAKFRTSPRAQAVSHKINKQKIKRASFVHPMLAGACADTTREATLVSGSPNNHD